MQQHNKALHILNIVLAAIVFLALCAYAGLWLLLSGVIGGAGLWGVAPSSSDFIPLIGVILGLAVFIKAAIGKSNPAFMWVASVIVFVSMQISTMLSISSL